MLWQSCSTVQFHLCQKLTEQFCERILSNYTYESPMKRSAKGEAESHSSAFTKRRHMLQVKYKSLKVTSRIILPWQDFLKLHRNVNRPSSNCHMQLHLVDLYLVDIHTFQLKSLFAWSMWEQNKKGMENHFQSLCVLAAELHEMTSSPSGSGQYHIHFMLHGVVTFFSSFS